MISVIGFQLVATRQVGDIQKSEQMVSAYYKKFYSVIFATAQNNHP
jgi:hypothetical protein